MTKPPRNPALRQQPSAPAAVPPIVSPRWLLSAFALTLCAAAVCGYGALCLLFYQGQWQFLFHPSHDIAATPATAGLAFDDIRFDVTDTGLPRLDGWWIPATSAAPYAASTILYLHDARGSLSDTIPALAAIHNLGINVFAIDYQGFGRSAGSHPTERLATQNSIAAFAWLTDTRHISPRSIVVCGDGVGAAFAAHLAALFAPAGAILQDPSPPARQIFLQDARARLVPLVLLQKERLDPAADLARAHIPRLFLDRQGDAARTRQLFHASSDPKEYFDLRAASPSMIDAALRRFLDEVLR
jgi:hypothetical protein